MKLTAIDTRGPFPVYIYSGGAFASFERLHTMEEELNYLATLIG